MKSDSILADDFWWLPKNVAIESLSVGVGHHRPLTDEDEPCSAKWFHSLDKDKEILSEAEEHYPLDFLSKWRDICKNTNVYRTLKLFDSNTGKTVLLGPFLIDIDNSILDDGYRENLDDSQVIARMVISYLVEVVGLSSSDLRIFFSGRKGFNIEVYPQALGINGSIDDQIKLSSEKQDEIIAFLRQNNNIQDSPYVSKNKVSIQDTVIDRIYGDRFGYRLKHPYIRAHNSINAWIQNDRNRVARRKIELTTEELLSMSATEITSRAEELAQTSKPS